MFILCSMLAIRNMIRENNAPIITTLFFSERFPYFYVCVYETVCHVCTGAFREEGFKSPATCIRDSCEPPNMDAGI